MVPSEDPLPFKLYLGYMNYPTETNYVGMTEMPQTGTTQGIFFLSNTFHIKCFTDYMGISVCVCVWHRGAIHVDPQSCKFKRKNWNLLSCGEAYCGSWYKIYQCHFIYYPHHNLMQVLEWNPFGLEWQWLQSKYKKLISLSHKACPFKYFIKVKIIVFKGWCEVHTGTHPVPLQPPHIFWELLLCHSQSCRPVTHCWAFCNLCTESSRSVLRRCSLPDLPAGGCVGTEKRHSRHG